MEKTAFSRLCDGPSPFHLKFIIKERLRTIVASLTTLARGHDIMERLRRTLRWRNSSTQTRAEAVGLANQAGETFFQGVRDMTMQNPTFIQHIHGGEVVHSIRANKCLLHSSDPSTSQPDGLSTAVRSIQRFDTA